MTGHAFSTQIKEIGGICRDWWMDLAAIDAKTGEEKEGGNRNRGKLAELRRIGIETLETGDCIDVAAAVPHWPYQKLRGRLAGIALPCFHGNAAQDEFDQAVAVVAATLARVRTETPKIRDQKVAALLGLSKDGKPVTDDEAARVMAEARFKRLIRVRDWPGLLGQGRRMVHLLGRDVPVADLGASLLLWNSSRLNPLIIRRWSFAYYGADFADPDATEPPVAAEAAAT